MNGDLKRAVLETARQAFDEGLFAGTSGNISCFDGERVFITPSSMPYNKMVADDIMILSPDGDVVEGSRRPSTEWRMHTEVYKRRGDIGAVFHTHSPYATSFAVLREAIPLIQVEMFCYLGGDVFVADFAIPGTAEMAESALVALEKRNSCLLANHGVLSVGRTIEEAYLAAVYTEEVSRLYHLAKTTDRDKINLVPDEAADYLRKKYNCVP